MNETKQADGISILRFRWESRLADCKRRLANNYLDIHEREVLEREQLIYETVLHEFITRLGLAPDRANAHMGISICH